MQHIQEEEKNGIEIVVGHPDRVTFAGDYWWCIPAVEFLVWLGNMKGWKGKLSNNHGWGLFLGKSLLYCVF